jgi:2-iminobutanoate/2-iminopropanoate deaminase
MLTVSHIKKIVEADGGSVDNIVKCTVHLSNINDFNKFDHSYSSFFPGIKPARTTVQSVLSEGIKIEMDAVAKI